MWACSPGDRCLGQQFRFRYVAGDVPLLYVKRPVSALGNPTDAVVTGQGGDLYLARTNPHRAVANETSPVPHTTGGRRQSPDRFLRWNKIVFAMRGRNDANWSIWELRQPVTKAVPRRIACDRPSKATIRSRPICPTGASYSYPNRQETTKRQMQAQGIALGLQPTSLPYVDEYDREQTTVLHVMNSGWQQLSPDFLPIRATIAIRQS